MHFQSLRASGFLGSHADPDAPRTCTLGYIRAALGRRDYGDKRMVTYVTLLVEHHGFPKPLPTLRKKALTGAVTPDSNWLRDAVDAWLEDFLPPEAGAQLDAAAKAAAAADMDNAAAQLGRGRLRVVGGSQA